MKFKQLSIENFMAIGEATLSLEDRGLVLVQGENRDDSSQDSNGAGKSSIVDSLCWCLYGQTAREETGDAVINDKVGKNCRVSLTIDDDGTEYTVTRHRKYTGSGNSLMLTQNGTDLTQGTDKLTQERVNQVIGSSYQVFRASVYGGQDVQTDLLKMTDKFLKQIVEEAAGIDRLQSAHDLAKTKLKEAKEKLDLVDRDKFQHQMTIDDAEFYVEKAKKRIDEYEEEREGRVNGLELAVKSRKEKASSLVKAIKAANIESVKSEYEDLINKAVDEEWQNQLAHYQDSLSGCKEEIATKKGELNALKLKLAEAKQKIVDNKSLLGQPCSECGKPYTEEDLADVLKAAREFIDTSLPIAKKVKARVDELEKQAESIAELIKAHHASVTVSDEDKARREALRASIDDYESKMKDAKTLKSDITDKIAELDAVKTAENPYNKDLEEVNQRVEGAKQALEEIDARIAEERKAVEVAQAVVEVYGNTGVRAHILDTVTPYLNQQTSEYLSQLSDGNIEALWSTLTTNSKGELREKFSIEVKSATGGKRHGLLSGGEKRKARLATNMALQDLVASRATKPIDLYIGDEIDDALDKSGLERLMNLLEERAKQRGTVMVISHNELSDWISEVITVVKDGGFATIVE